MARPFTTRTPTRVQVPVGQSQQPALRVSAPLDVRTPGADTSPLSGLVQALGIGADVYGKVAQAKNERDFAEGQADEMLGAADVERAKKSRAYSDGAFQTLTLEQYQNAEARVTRRAAEELDRSLPIDQQVHIIDGWMKSELGPLVTDPRAKVLFAPRYQRYIDGVAQEIQKDTLTAHAKQANEVLDNDWVSALESGAATPEAWNENFHLRVSQTGDPVAARRDLVASTLQVMVNAATSGDPKWDRYLDAIPTEVKGPDGASLPGPMRNAEIRALVNQGKTQAQQLFDKAQSEKYATDQVKAYVTADEWVNNGDPVSLDTFKAHGFTIGNKPSDMFSPERAASIIDQAAASRARMAAKQAEQQSYDAILQTYGGRLADAKPFFPSTEKFNDFAQTKYTQFLSGLGVPPEGWGGEALVKNKQALDQLLVLSAQQGVPYEPLKATLNSVNPQAAGDVQARLDAYELTKARNLAGLYVTDDQALIYETGLSARAAGMDPKGIADTIHRMGDKDTLAYVRDNTSEINKAIGSGFRINDGGLFGTETTSTRASNSPYLSGLYRTLATQALSKGLPVDAAKSFAQDRINQTHTILHLNSTLGFGGEMLVLPRSLVSNPKEATRALDWYTSELPRIAKEHDIPDTDQLTIRPVVSLGRSVSFQVFRAGGVVPVADTSFTLDGLMKTYYRMNPKLTPQGRAQSTQDAAKAAEAFQRDATRARFGNLPGVTDSNP